MTDPTAEPRPLLRATADDPALERALRADLATLRDRVPGSPLARMIDEVLTGRRSLRDVARTPEWGAAVAPAAEAAATRWAGLTPEERETLAAQGRADIEREARRGQV